MAMTASRHRGPSGSDRPRPSRPWTVHVPFGVVVLLVLAAALRILQYHWREGAVLVGVALLVGGLLRAVLPEDRVGLLAIRGKVVDVVTYAALCAAVFYIALTITGGPFDLSS
ncbi:DUF3017 domain-containing protein [Amycolatopsis sp. FDAARGOS 1241]|uniref:DUF3017 domain-containing protein n=1 Tax=Amycolatopsis sp. FDAARGOS 1241 TaxID=2778070 RepID=UPI00351C5FE0